jgi:3-oxoacyl-[acyl-carrier-protein] synthase III
VLGECIVDLPWPGRELFTSAMSFGLRRLHDEGAVGSGDLVVLAGASSGVQIGAALYRF